MDVGAGRRSVRSVQINDPNNTELSIRQSGETACLPFANWAQNAIATHARPGWHARRFHEEVTMLRVLRLAASNELVGPPITPALTSPVEKVSMAQSTGRTRGSATSTVMPSRSLIWLAIFIGSTIGGAIPELWGAGILSYSSLLLSGVGALAGLWIAFKI